MTKIFRAPPDAERCTATIPVGKGADDVGTCTRRRVIGFYCVQHDQLARFRGLDVRRPWLVLEAKLAKQVGRAHPRTVNLKTPLHPADDV